MIDEELDPVGEIRAIRKNLMRKYKTLDAYFDHLSTLPSPQEMRNQIKAKLAKSSKAQSRPAPRRDKRTAKA